MKINIIRGQDQIGGNIVEISTKTTKILLDIGCELENENVELPKIEGLFDYKGYDSIFISHYHGDHMGLAYSIYDEIPLYIGENSYKIIKASDEYKAVKTISPAGFMVHKMPIQVGDMTVTPYLCDHSAFDSYMILVEAEGESVLYTGDFRSNGRKPFDWLLKQLPTKVDTLICEGTRLSRENFKNETEQELEIRAVELFSKTNGPIFVLQSSMNIDRIVTIFRAAKKSNRILLQDLYMAEITNAIGGNIPNPNSFSEVKTFITKPYNKEHFRYKLFNKYGGNKISKAQISKKKFVMCIRTSMDEYLKTLSKKVSFKGGLLIYSFWSGYKEQPEMKGFLKDCENLGLEIITLHASGHADPETIKELIKHTNPTKIAPIHTKNTAWFETEYGDRIIK